MVRTSNWCITVLNFLTMLLACSSILLAFKLHGNTDSSCANSLKVPFLVVGGVLLVVSFLGMVGACCRVTFFMWIYIFLLIMVLLGLIGFTVYMVVVANKGFVSFGNDGLEHTINDFSSSLQKFTTNTEHWNKLKSCMDEARFCKGFEEGKDEQYYKTHMSPIQWGCCTPPKTCGFNLQNATYWIVPESSPASSDKDCSVWSNTQNQLCYDCETCKTSILADTQKQWKFMSFINFFVIIFVNIVLMTACCAHDNNQDQRYKKYRGGYYA